MVITLWFTYKHSPFFVEIKETVSRKKSSIRRLNTSPRYCFTFLESSVEELQFFKMAPSFYKSCVLISWNLLRHACTPNGVRPELAIYMFSSKLFCDMVTFSIVKISKNDFVFMIKLYLQAQ